MIRLPLREISYIDVRRNYVTFHAKRDYAVKKTLSEIETLLDERFFRAGRSTLINLSFVSRVTRSDVYLTDGSRVPIPRSAYEPLNRAIIAIIKMFSKQIDRRIARYQNDLIKTHYDEVENMYRQMRGWRHDYRNHIQVMKVYAAKGDMEAIKAYLDKLDTDLSTVDTVVKTGNPMADAILNSKISLARSKHIEVKADAHVPYKLTTSEIDLCVIIGNLFDNAIEASLALPENERLIRVYMDMKNTQLYISVTNFTAGKKLIKHDGRFASTKGQGHGFGLVRTDNVIKRLNGYISRNSEDGAFTTEILLPQGENSSPENGNLSPK